MPKKEHTFEKHPLGDDEVRTLISWKAPARPYKKRSREFYLMVIFVTLCASIILYLFKEYMLMATVFSIAFLGTVLVSSKPHDVEHKITTQAVITDEHAHLYKELYDFWFDEKDGNKIIYIRTVAFFPGVLSLLLGDVEENKVRDVLVRYIAYREVMKKNFMDKASNWLTKNFPLESSTKS